MVASERHKHRSYPGGPPASGLWYSCHMYRPRLKSTLLRPGLSAAPALLLPAALLLATLLLAALPLTGCASDASKANESVDEGDALRATAVDTLRKSTATVDGMVRAAAAGQALPADQTKTTTEAAIQDINDALGGLNTRGDKLTQSQSLPLNPTYQDYLRLLRESNDRLVDTLNAALEIPRLMEKEQYSLAGWDEIKTQQIVVQIDSMQQRIEQLYSESESLRNRAEKLRADNPDAFSG